MSELIVRIEMPKDCLWLEDGEIHKCPLLAYNDCCMGQSDEANEASETWDDLRKGCPIVCELPKQHGRLVDADDVNNHIIGYVDLRDCPTIVPATERSET